MRIDYQTKILKKASQAKTASMLKTADMYDATASIGDILGFDKELQAVLKNPEDVDEGWIRGTKSLKRLYFKNEDSFLDAEEFVEFIIEFVRDSNLSNIASIHQEDPGYQKITQWRTDYDGLSYMVKELLLAIEQF